MTLPYKYRGILLLVLLVVVLPGAAWRFALREAFGAWRDCRRLSARLETLAPAIVRETAAADPDRELILSGGLLDSVRRAAGKQSIQIAGYEPIVTAEQEGVAVHTAQLTLTGGFTELVQVVDALERSLPACRLRSLAWGVKTDRRTRHTQLLLTLYIQQIALNE